MMYKSFILLVLSLLPPNSKTITDVVETSNELLVESIIQVESRGNPSAYCVSEEAVGCLQIRPIMLREVNNILKRSGDEKRYELSDRWDCEKSKEMFHIWKNYHHKYSDFEKIARNWNGGPLGYKKNSTIGYWKKVEEQLNLNTFNTVSILSH